MSYVKARAEGLGTTANVGIAERPERMLLTFVVTGLWGLGVPYILPASHYGERVAFYYTLAWFDRYLRGSDRAFARLTARTFDGSSDAHSIGGGTYSATQASSDNPTWPRIGERHAARLRG